MRGKKGTTKPVARDVVDGRRGEGPKTGRSEDRSIVTKLGVTMALGALLLAALVPLGLDSLSRTAAAKTLPDQAQIIDQKSFAVLETVPPPSEANATTVCPFFLLYLLTCSSKTRTLNHSIGFLYESSRHTRMENLGLHEDCHHLSSFSSGPESLKTRSPPSPFTSTMMSSTTLLARIQH